MKDIFTSGDFHKYKVENVDKDKIQLDIMALKEKDGSGINVKNLSDGYHTFDDLYNHRMALTIALCKTNPHRCWRSLQHGPDDNPMFDGSFIVGFSSPKGQITYHYNLEHWDKFDFVRTLDMAPNWDGHTPEDCIERLINF